MTRIIVLSALLLFTTVLSVQSQKEIEYKNVIRSKLHLFYSMPDYSTSKINSKIMGPRIAKILATRCDNYQQYMNISALSVIQSNQVEGLSYGRIKKMKLDNVSKQGDEILIRFETTLEHNNLNLMKS